MARKASTKRAKTEEEELREYELIVIFNPEITEDTLNAVMGKMNQFITEKGGTPPTVEPWGKRKLAYPIKRSLEGNYVLVHFQMSPKWTKDLEVDLHISEEVLRHLLVRLSG